MCVWKVDESERNCEYCSYSGGCEERERVIPIEEPGALYAGILSALVGSNILAHSRKRELVWARNMACYRLVMDGYSQGQVGKFMGLNHATVFHGKEQVANMLEMPSMYPTEVRVWEKFTELLSLNKN